ncbi:hypothetical protein CH333_03255 [candidate division WOR-3 bacterium JGI_Cruoil_03_44_89]|uniref:Uncharacterized protein n=1 Tax=candidate division WOR-3 bacterium JGI_Cruoil_03_44_89 TaxID=1973748 RepID=A0A235BVW3_UNCW3|nr:MAG: hypothetical protein CH333_03255 [candidate division WOR-3 bacterium JGI_Cruoil_03_44_89]
MVRFELGDRVAVYLKHFRTIQEIRNIEQKHEVENETQNFYKYMLEKMRKECTDEKWKAVSKDKEIGYPKLILYKEDWCLEENPFGITFEWNQKTRRPHFYDNPCYVGIWLPENNENYKKLRDELQKTLAASLQKRNYEKQNEWWVYKRIFKFPKDDLDDIRELENNIISEVNFLKRELSRYEPII